MTTSSSNTHEERPSTHDGEKAKPKRNNNRRRNRNQNRKKEEQNSSAGTSQADAKKLTENEGDIKVVEQTNNADTPPPPAATTTQPKKSTAQFSSITFASLSDKISKDSLRALTEKFGFEFMTKVQEATLEPVLTGKDVLARAKTGSGKTVAFLLPTIEVMAKAIQNDNLAGIGGLVLSPTRELALQIQNEVMTLTTFHKGISTVCLIGGTNMKKDVTRLKSRKVNLIVATPGRLLDHLQKGTEDLSQRLQSVQMLVFDEADRLLDMGFRDTIQKILKFLSSHQKRQTLLFSATLPESLESITSVAMKPDHVFVDTLEEGEKDTNVQVAQSYGISSIEDQFVYLEHYLRQHIQESKTEPDGYKIMVFFNTARTAGFMSELFTKTMGMPILEMHSRKTQGYRSRVASQFTTGKNLIMFSSDVSARGVDYENVSLVLQVGLTDRDQYIHRIGRTARAGRKGKGILILQDFEQSFVKELKDLNLDKLSDTPSYDTAKNNEIKQIIQSSKELTVSAERAYQGYLGFYNSNLKRLKLDKKDCVGLANEFGQAMGFEEPPFLEAKTVRKMGLQGVGGLRIGGRGGGGGGQGRGGRGGRGGGRGRGRDSAPKY